MNRLALMTGILSLTLVGDAAQAQTQSSETQPGSQPKLYQYQAQASGAARVSNGTTSSSSDSAQKSTGFFSGWFQRMDDESSAQIRDVQPGYQPKFHRQQTTSQESQGPGITYPNEQAAGAGDPASLNRISPAAGTPAGGSSLMTEMQKCEQLTDLTGRADCELQAHKKAGQAVELSRPSIEVDSPYDRNNNGGGAGAE